MNKRARSGIAVGIVLIILALVPNCGTLFSKKPKVGNQGEPGWMTITSRPTAVPLFFDGHYKYTDRGSALTTPATVQLSPGYYDLTLKLEGYLDWRDTVKINVGETTRVFVPMRSLWDEGHFKSQADAVFTLGTVLAVALIVFSLFTRNIILK